MIDLPFALGFYISDSLPVANQECVNLYVNVPQIEGALAPQTYFGSAGLDQLVTTGAVSNANRGAWVKDGIPYELNGTVLYRFERSVTVTGVESFAAVAVGTIPGGSRASFSDNGTQLMVIAEGDGFIIDESSATEFQEITDLGFKANGVPQHVVFIDTFFVVTTDSKKFIRCDSNNGLSWNSLNVFTAEADPDDVVAPIVHNNQLFVGGGQTFEAFQNVAGNFQRITGLFIPKGLSAPFGIINSSGTFMWVGGGEKESPAIWSFVGNAAQKISNTAVDAALGAMSAEDIEAGFAYAFAQDGAFFTGFTFPDRTFEHNSITDRWNERKSTFIDANGTATFTRWRVNSVVKAYNRIIVGDSIDGRIGDLSLLHFGEYGEEIRRIWSVPTLSNDGEPFSISNLEVTMESGTGTATVEPQITMQASRDAKTFNLPLPRGFGFIGQFTRRCVWALLGDFERFAVLRFEISSSTAKVAVLKVQADF